MLAIFLFSSQPGTVSGALSDRVADAVEQNGAGALAPGWFSINQYANIRKWAHIYIYCALGVSMALTVHAWARRGGLLRQALAAVVFCTVFAASDELHQYFVPGRAMLLTDVGVDMLGFIPCIALTFLLIAWRTRRKK